MIAPGSLVVPLAANLFCGTTYKTTVGEALLGGWPMVVLSGPALVIANINVPSTNNSSTNLVCLLPCGIDMLVFTWIHLLVEVEQ